MYSRLIDPQTLQRHLQTPGWRVLDCRATLGEPAAGRAEYQTGHIPGAAFADRWYGPRYSLKVLGRPATVVRRRIARTTLQPGPTSPHRIVQHPDPGHEGHSQRNANARQVHESNRDPRRKRQVDTRVDPLQQDDGREHSQHDDRAARLPSTLDTRIRCGGIGIRQ